jgi:hypothetical protein
MGRGVPLPPTESSGTLRVTKETPATHAYKGQTGKRFPAGSKASVSGQWGSDLPFRAQRTFCEANSRSSTVMHQSPERPSDEIADLF